jgi:hypothetical protein
VRGTKQSHYFAVMFKNRSQLRTTFEKNRKILFLPLVLIGSNQTLASDNFTFGAGLGFMYSGLGVNVGIKSKTDLFNSENTNHGTSNV